MMDFFSFPVTSRWCSNLGCKTGDSQLRVGALMGRLVSAGTLDTMRMRFVVRRLPGRKVSKCTGGGRGGYYKKYEL